MKKTLLTVTGSIVIAFFGYLLFFASNDSAEKNILSPAANYKEQYKEVKKRKTRDEQGIKYAAKYLEELLANQITGKIDYNDILKAREQVQARRMHRSKRSELNLLWEELGPDNVGGRTRAILIDQKNPSRVYAGGVTGGLFISDNGGLSWSPHPDNEQFGYQGISSIKQASNGDIYFGTGESFVYTENNTVGHIGGGIYKSIDGGKTFEVLPSTVPVAGSASDAWAFINEIAIDPNDPQKIYAATSGGLQISLDGGNSAWTKAQGTPNGSSREVAVGPDGTVYAMAGNNYYRSSNGIDFELRHGMDGFPGNNISRVEFATTPLDPNYVYCVIANNAGALRGVYRSIDKGLSWEPSSPENSPAFNPLGQQGDYDITIAVDGGNKERIFIGGQLELMAGGKDIGWSLIAFWQPKSPTNPYYVHADMHTIIFHPTNPDIMYVGTDGGIFKTTNASAQYPTFTERNKGYNVTQFYNMWATHSGELLAGAQDNGTSYIDCNGNTRQSAEMVVGGDGGYTAISEINPLAFYSEIQFSELRRSSNGGESFSSYWDAFAADATNPDRPKGWQSARFIAPYRYWEESRTMIDTIFTNSDTVSLSPLTLQNDTIFKTIENGYILYGGSGRIYITPDALNFSIQPRWYQLGVTGTVSAFENTEDGRYFYVGTASGVLYRIENVTTAEYSLTGNVVTGINVVELNRSWPGGSNTITGIGVNPHDPGHIIVTFARYGNQNYVFEGINANTTPTFNSIQGDLPKMPVYDAIIDYYNRNNIIIGTDLGVWSTVNGGLTWEQENQGLNAVPTFSMVQEMLYDKDCQVIYAGTYGRGIFRTTTLLKINQGESACITQPCLRPVGVEDKIILPEVTAINLYPNPIRDQAIVEVELSKSSLVSVYVIDLLGKVIQSHDLGMVNTGFNRFNLNFNGVPGGAYLVNIKTNHSTSTKRVIVL